MIVQKSEIHGLGLFVNNQYPVNSLIAKVFVKKGGKYIQTMFGRFINHSDNPNTKLVEHDGCIYLVAIRRILLGEELTSDYRECKNFDLTHLNIDYGI